MKLKPQQPEYPLTTPCKIAIVGDFPDDEASIVGRPFVGKQGKLLNGMLRSVGINRKECLVTNVFNLQPPENDLFNWCITAKDVKDWEKEHDPYALAPIQRGKYLHPDYHHHLERFYTELAIAEPTVIITLGGPALWAMCGYSNIMKRRGAITSESMYDRDTKILPTLHPSQLAYSFGMYPIVIQDLLKAKNESFYPEIRTTPREIWVEPSLSDLDKFYNDHILNADVISIDIETPYFKFGIPENYRQIKCIGFSVDETHSIVVPLIDERQPDFSYWKSPQEEASAWKWIRKVCGNSIPKLGQNFGTFDAHWLWDKYKIVVKNYCYDTRLIHHALYPELPKDLGTLGALYANEIAWKNMRTDTIKRDE